MKTKVPFAGRAALLAALMLGVSSVAAVRLAELQIFDTGNHRPAAVDDLIDTESIPAQRGIIMDRNEELLTNNIQSAELVADRYHLREITAVVEGLAHNHAVNDPRWESLTDPKERRKLVYNYRAKLLNNAKADMTDEERLSAAPASTPRTPRPTASWNTMRRSWNTTSGSTTSWWRRCSTPSSPTRKSRRPSTAAPSSDS